MVSSPNVFKVDVNIALTLSSRLLIDRKQINRQDREREKEGIQPTSAFGTVKSFYGSISSRLIEKNNKVVDRTTSIYL